MLIFFILQNKESVLEGIDIIEELINICVDTMTLVGGQSGAISRLSFFASISDLGDRRCERSS